jgi:hypothetical protein
LDAIRRGNLVPLEEDIDSRELVRLFPWLTIADLSEPETATIEVAGAAVTRRFATGIRKANWIDFVDIGGAPGAFPTKRP